MSTPAIYNELYRDRNYPPGNPMATVSKLGLTANMKVVDLGCGKGTLSNFFADYTGIDFSSWVIAQNLQTNRGKYVCADLTDLSCLQGERFDVVICSDVMEHLEPSQVDTVLDQIGAIDAPLLAFNISTRDSAWRGPQGETLHPTIYTADHWGYLLESRFNICVKIIGQDYIMVSAEPFSQMHARNRIGMRGYSAAEKFRMMFGSSI